MKFRAPELLKAHKDCTGFRYEEKHVFVFYWRDKSYVMEKRPGYSTQFGKGRRWTFRESPWSELYRCDRCGKFGPKWRIWHTFTGNLSDEIGMPTEKYSAHFCIGCHNKFQAISRRLYALNEAASLIRKHKRNLNESTKNTPAIA